MTAQSPHTPMPSLDTKQTTRALALKAEHPDWGYIRIGNEIGWHKDKVRRAIEKEERKRGAVNPWLTDHVQGKTGWPMPVEIEPRTADEFAERITSCWRKSVEAIIEVGRLLTNAKAQLDHGEFTAMVNAKLPFGPRTATRLMAIGRDSRLTNRTHVSVLPNSWGTLYELTKLDDDQFQAKIADGTIRPEMERKDIAPAHQERRIEVQRSLSDETAVLAVSGRKFPVIYADPATKFLAGLGPKSTENHYRTMSMDALCAMGDAVQARCLPSCQAFIWSTVPQLALTITRILPAWGFTYSSSCMWDKTDADHENEIGPGFVFRNQHEILLYCTRGNPPGPYIKPLSIYRERKREHSRKPDYYRQMIADMTRNLPVLELFARVDAEHPLPTGWKSWGNETGD
ncbi:MAG TPA: MT-A70 family methyltransferase [Steroidobacteraceae bacterium]|jgi:N6-adenosine-specific RNA methylase IME4|nr:MT-A70 family methyltransferase [Steroidobacteraceae bacterium]